MTVRHPDPEQLIRQWLADTAPDQAPASLRAALEEATVRPAGRDRPWPRLGQNGLRFAGRVAAAVAILAVAGAGAFFYSTSRPKGPSAAVVDSPTASAPSNPASNPSEAEQLVGNWHIVDTKMMDDQPGAFLGTWSTRVFSLSRGGFVTLAFDPNLSQTVVFHSADGTNWADVGSLPTKYATVSAVTDSGGNVVAVGYGYDEVANRADPIAWVSSDLRTWHASVLPAPTNTGVDMITAGPAGFLASGHVLAKGVDQPTTFWTSANGTSWRTVTGPVDSATQSVEDLSANSAGFVVRTNDGDQIQTWQSFDGSNWKMAWSRSADAGAYYYSMGRPTLQASGGSYITVGTSGSPGSVVLWTSGDLTHWTMADDIKWDEGTPYVYGAISGGLMAAGWCGPNVPSCPNGGTAVWTTPDGRTWQRDPNISAIDGTYGCNVTNTVSDGTHVIVVLTDANERIRLLVGTELR